MARLTKSDIERKLSTGSPVSWNDGGKKTVQLLLGSPKARSLFQFILTSSVRNPTSLPDGFIAGLADAYENGADPAIGSSSLPTSAGGVTIWKLKAIETDGFGGVNTWKGPTFRFDFDGESLLIEGPNGSGKSSLTGAILWALTGERPRDQVDGANNDAQPVFQADDKSLIGKWPPLACYPSTVAELKSLPRVRVHLEFVDDAGNMATVERVLENGAITHSVDPVFDVPSVFIETGLLMPARLAVMRLGGGSSRMTDAVQMLTGMDDLAAIGSLVEGLCHKSREYLAYKKKELSDAKKEFEGYITTARTALLSVNVAVASFLPVETSDNASELAKFGKLVADKAKELTAVIESDLGPGLAIETAAGQNKVVAAIAAAEAEVHEGLSSLVSWKLLEALKKDLTVEVVEAMEAAIGRARSSADECLELFAKSGNDTKFQLKAVAAQWHAEHHGGAIMSCPLCEHDLAESKLLSNELEALRSAGSAAARRFDDNVNAIIADLNSSIPSTQKHIAADLISWEPRKALAGEIEQAFVLKERYSRILIKFSVIVEAALERAPTSELNASSMSGNPALDLLNQRLSAMERAIALVRWFQTEEDMWTTWWENTTSAISAIHAVDTGGKGDNEEEGEALSAHLTRLSSALSEAKPYSTAAASIRSAWTTGKMIVLIDKELERRIAIAGLLEPLKALNSLVQSIAREAIDGLSGRIEKLLKQIHVSEQLKFQDAQLQKKEGVIVYGGFGGEIRIDATLVANTSWLRAVLWSFIFALREEAVEQFSVDVLPVLVFDDPQATFDFEHRHRWALHVASLQDGSSRAQLILATHDQMFLELIKIGGISGRQAMSAAAGAELGFMGIFEGASLQRKWDYTIKQKTPEAGREYLSAVRIYLEGVLKLMLRGEDGKVATFVIGDSRNKIEHLHNTKIPPWERSEFGNLAKLLGKNVTEIKYIESAHHASWSHLGMPEAIAVEEYWRKKLHPLLDACIRLARNYFIMHSGLTALRAPSSSITLPEGHKAKVAQIPLKILGKAAALSDGRIADGCIDMDVYAPGASKKITLAQHSAYRLRVSTLEPVARPGDMLLVKEAGEPSVKSLVVALSENRVLARRFEVADNHADIAVLTAQAINPRKIAPPVIAQKATLTFFKIVGVLYEDAGWAAPERSDEEVCECAGEAVLSGVISEALGLVEVVGQSAEPHALNGQYIIIEKQLMGEDALKRLDGKPVIASDTDDNRYFKRLRVGTDRIVLESMDSGGDFAPVILGMPGNAGNCLTHVWPVAGVLFELPN
ncbi:AAA family ATPase [Granulicella sp. dw_53]|uniref:AAA family ATPase n=1 Tax=Granulicella sp. dw_53 TaxID=2719792 RepID=UPI001BD27A57|nr:AAA family ATPase [Granulicella sp. dw_53]